MELIKVSPTSFLERLIKKNVGLIIWDIGLLISALLTDNTAVIFIILVLTNILGLGLTLDKFKHYVLSIKYIEKDREIQFIVNTIKGDKTIKTHIDDLHLTTIKLWEQGHKKELNFYYQGQRIITQYEYGDWTKELIHKIYIKISELKTVANTRFV